MNKFLLLIAILSKFVFSSSNVQPNFVIIYVDDMGYADIGKFQDEKISTPNLDVMASNGQTWTNFYASSSVCTPSRAGLLTGMLPVRNGLYGDQIAVFFPGSKTGIPKNQLTLAEVFQTNGYATGIFGKWHLGDAEEFLPTRHGFDEYIGIPYSNDMDWNVNGITFDKLISRPDLYEEYAKISSVITEQIFNPNIKDWNVPLLRSIKRSDGYTDEVLERPADQELITKNYTEYSINFLEQSVKNNKPFFLFLSHSMPHVPLFRSEDFVDKSKLGIYGDVIEEIAWSVGQIISTLKKLNQNDNTYIIFTSDNGPWLLYGPHGGKAEPLRSGKGTTFEGGMRVMTIISGPNVKKGIIDDIGSQTDIFKTFLSLANIKSDFNSIDSFDLSETIKDGRPSMRKFIPYFVGSELRAFRYKDHKIHFVTQGAYNMPPPREVHKNPLLYNLSNDIGETRDISDVDKKTLEFLIVQSDLFKKDLVIKKSIVDSQFQ